MQYKCLTFKIQLCYKNTLKKNVIDNKNRKEKHINLVQQLKPLYIRLGKLKLKNFLGANRRKLDNIGMFEMPFISKTASYFASGILASVRLITRLIGNKRK